MLNPVENWGTQYSVTDTLGGTTQSIYDPLVQLLSSTDPEGFTTNYTTMCSDA